MIKGSLYSPLLCFPFSFSTLFLLPPSLSLSLQLCVPGTATVEEDTATLQTSVSVARAGAAGDVNNASLPRAAVSVSYYFRTPSVHLVLKCFFLFLAELGGYCNVPGECICRDGYSGANCEIGKCFFIFTLLSTYFHVSTSTFMFLTCFILMFPYLHSHVSRPDSVSEGKPLFSGGALLQ